MTWEEYALRCRQIAEKAKQARSETELAEIKAEMEEIEQFEKQ